MSALLDYLQRLKNQDDRGALADLRNGLKETQKYRAWPLLAGFFKKNPDDDRYCKVVRTVAGLYAYHSQVTQNGNIGQTCRDMMSENERNKMHDAKAMGPICRRFQHLLAASRDEICDRVVRLVLYAKSKEISVNYEQLEKDLHYWSDRVKTRWAQSFWIDSSNNEE